MLATKEKLVEVTLQDGSELSAFDDYIGKFLESTKDYYEKNILDYFKEYIPHSSVIYDLGANIGNHTLYFSKHAGAKKIFSFEPAKETFDVLEGNVKRNQLSNVELFNLGVGSENKTASLVPNRENMGASFLSLDDKGDIQVVSIDSLDIPAPDFIKMDVEGFEYQALQGAKETLMSYKPVIWIEIFQENYQEVDQLLTSLGYIQMDRWFENYIYVNPSSQDELLEYVNRFKVRPLNRFTEQSRETNRKYKNVTTKLAEVTKKLEMAESKYRQSTSQVTELKEVINTNREQQNNASNSYEHLLKVEQMKNEHLKATAELNAKVITLETERRNVVSFLEGEGDIIFNILQLQNEIKALREERHSLKEEAISLRGEVEKLLLLQEFNYEKQIEELVKDKSELEKQVGKANQKVTELERRLTDTQNLAIDLSKQHEITDKKLLERIEMIEEHNASLTNHKEILLKRLEEQGMQLKVADKALKDKTSFSEYISLEKDKLTGQISDLINQNDTLNSQIEELIAANVNLGNDLRDAMVDKINLLNKEEVFILQLEQEVVKSKKIEHEKNALAKQHLQLKQQHEQLTKKYNALSGSKLGKVTIKYWKFAKKWARKGK